MPDLSEIQAFWLKPDGPYQSETGESYVKRGDRYYVSPARIASMLDWQSKLITAETIMESAHRQANPLIQTAALERQAWFTAVLSDINAPVREGWMTLEDNNGTYLTLAVRAMCHSCHLAFTGQKEKIEKDLMEHIAVCEKHPLGQRIRLLQERVRELEGKNDHVAAASPGSQ